MMADWNIPRLFTDADLFRATPDGANFAVGSQQFKLVRMLHLAAFIADLCVARGDQRQILLPLIVPHAAALDIDYGHRLVTDSDIEGMGRMEYRASGTYRALPMLGEPEAALA